MTTLGKLSALILICVICTGVSADPIVYGDYNVTSAQFLGVSEDGIDVGGVTQPLYGTPTPADNSLLFNPVSFGAYSSGFNSTTVDGKLETIIVPNEGYGIEGIAVIEGGDYTFAGANGTSATSVSADLNIFIMILEMVTVTEESGQTVVTTSYPLTTINSTHNILSADYGQGNPGDFWSGEVFRDIDGQLAENQFITKISVVIDNTLNASSEVGTEALINKKNFQLRAFVGGESYVPEPSTVVLLGLGGLSLLFLRRKSK